MTSPPLFWLLAFVLALGVLAALVWPLLRPRKGDVPPGEEAAATAVFRDHKRQLDAEVAAGTLSATERDAAQAELVARFGSELAEAPAQVVASSERSRWIAAIVLVAVIPSSAALLYLMLGDPAAVDAPPAAIAAEPKLTDPQILAMVDRLAEKMKANPEDGNGWMLLARSYLKMGRYGDSVAAYAEAAKRMPESAGLLSDQAEAVAMAQGQRLGGRPAELLARALALDPDYPKAIAMSAGAAAERGDYDGAITLWKRLKSRVAPNGEQSQQIDDVLAELEAARKGAPAKAIASMPSTTAPPGAPAAANIATPGVAGRVELDPRLAAKMAAGDALFIYARDPDGSRMPLAVMRGTAAELPKAFALTDAMAMTPNNTISRAKTVVVEARISKSGNATPQSGDLRGATSPVKPGAGEVRIVIDQIIP